MKISKLAFEARWKDYLYAIEKFGFIYLYAWWDSPPSRVEIIIKDKP